MSLVLAAPVATSEMEGVLSCQFFVSHRAYEVTITNGDNALVVSDDTLHADELPGILPAVVAYRSLPGRLLRYVGVRSVVLPALTAGRQPT